MNSFYHMIITSVFRLDKQQERCHPYSSVPCSQPYISAKPSILLKNSAFIAVFVMALFLWLAPAYAQTVAVGALTATPATVQPGQTIVFTATMTASQNASNYPVEFSLPNGTNQVLFTTFQAGKPATQTYRWTVPAGTAPGAKKMTLGVYNSSWQVPALVYASATFAVSATAGSAAAPPVNTQLPLISGSAQVGKLQTTSTGTWTGAATFAYQWAANGSSIAGATSSAYLPVTADAGRTLTASVKATGSGGTASAITAPTTPIVAASTTSARSFTPLHTYYISPTGNDSNNGLTMATAWKTPHHAVVCGDVIIAAAGTYGGSSSPFVANDWGVVSGCPSTSAGVDGTGGVYFATLLCAGPYITSCTVSDSTAEAFRVDQSNWAIEGFSASASNACFVGTSETTTTLHHIAFINDLASNCGNAGFSTYSWHGSTGGVDQTAIVGVIAFNSAHTNSTCGSGITIMPSKGPDASAGAHVFVAGAFSYGNTDATAAPRGCDPAGGGTTTDGNGIIFDSWNCFGAYPYQGVVEQSVLWGNGAAGFEMFAVNPSCQPQSDLSQLFLFKNTTYGNFQDPIHKGSVNGEVLLNNVSPSSSSVKSITNNILVASMATPGGAALNAGLGFGYQVYGIQIGCNNSCASPSLVVNGNYIWNAHTTTTTSSGGTNTNIFIAGANQHSNFIFGSNTYNNPGLANPAALPKVSPSCSGYATATDCMNAHYGVSAALTPSGAAVGKGYSPPGSCASDAYFPTWLKGVVHLSLTGSTLNENSGLITKPCNM